MMRPGSSRPPAIVADSTISLPADLIQGLPLFVVPLEIHHDRKVYLDGVDIVPRDFYRLQQTSDTLPSTSAPQPGAFLDAFRKASEVADVVICITLSAHLSSTHQAALSARHAARSVLPGLDIRMADSRTAGTAEGLIALDAARRAAAGATVEEVIAVIHQRIADVWLLGYLESLYYIWRGGRVPRVVMWMGHLLDVKPILELSADKIGMVERPRTRRRAMERIVALSRDRLAGRAGRVAVIHANAPDRADELAELIRRDLRVAELFVGEFTPVIGAHTGPGLVGCALHPVSPGIAEP